MRETVLVTGLLHSNIGTDGQQNEAIGLKDKISSISINDQLRVWGRKGNYPISIFLLASQQVYNPLDESP